MVNCNTCGRTFRDTLAREDHQRSTGHCYCRHCSRPFRHEQAFADHQRGSHDYRCGICNRSFAYSERLQGHQRSTGHGYCRKCERYFNTNDSLKQHRRAIHEHHCAQCTSVFTTAIGLQDHQRNKNHCYCQECDRFFTTQEALSHHLRSSVHVSQFRCLECERDFSSGQALEQHLNDKRNHGPNTHSIAPLEDGPCSCDECDRELTNRSALKQHRESLVHRPLSQLRCIASKKCKGRFTSPSALLHHLKSGACRSGMTRASLNQLISTHDPGNMITFGTQLGSLLDSAADWTSAGSSSPGLLTPSSHPSDTYSVLMGAQTTPSALSTGYFTLGTGQPLIARAGKFWCPLCPAQSRGFRTVNALGNHLASPAHAPKIFHCPISLTSSEEKGKQTEEMIKDFSTLSGLTQHVESGACEGGRQMLEGAMEFVQERLKALGFKNIKLLT